jgi:hypothetical protein
MQSAINRKSVLKPRAPSSAYANAQPRPYRLITQDKPYALDGLGGEDQWCAHNMNIGDMGALEKGEVEDEMALFLQLAIMVFM